ncbi:MAG TPA: rod shape-determining protein MreC [Candidatus Paceibacterota bacterium]|nr:rod shape-determining protein MreC [Candidatus Paceibacterota bacterium]
MTTISPNRRYRSQSARLRAISWAAGVGLVLMLAFILRGPLAGTVWRAGAPLMTARNAFAASSGILFSNFLSNQSLAAENSALRAELASTTIALQDRDLLYAQVEDLQARLGRDESRPRTLAAVLMSPPVSAYDTLLLDAGSEQGVMQGDLVAAGGSVYIGRVTEVYPTTSRATLYSAPGETFEAVLTHTPGNAATPVSVAGQGAGSLSGEVPASTPVSIGDSVTLPGLGVELVARVTATENNAAQSFTTVYLQLPVNPFTLQYVELEHPAH